uniref:Uncharacterized protein n=1 Tax=Plectus sambesii TaxID=2011161 RepID=A0A914WRL9_9BILA
MKTSGGSIGSFNRALSIPISVRSRRALIGTRTNGLAGANRKTPPIQLRRAEGGGFGSLQAWIVSGRARYVQVALSLYFPSATTTTIG